MSEEVLEEKNKVTQNKSPLWLEILLGALAFILPLVALIVIFSVSGYSLSGHGGNTVIMFDMQSQYISILRDYRNALINNKSLVYTMDRTFGGEYLSIFGYYLASPFNLFTVFVKENDLPLFFAWSNILKMAFASLNMYLLFRFSTKKVKIGYLGFAFAYGLISYSLVEMHNFMWLDSVMILPLIILGLKYLEQGKYHWIYALSLAYALMTSWYLGALICIFLVIFFIYRYICIKERKKRIEYLIRFGATSLVGGLIAGMFWFTSFMHLAGTKATGGLPKELKFFPISVFFSGLLTNNFETSESLSVYSGYATMFTSVITLVFFQLFLFNKKVSLKERISTLAVFLLYFLVVSNNKLNALFHGGQEPTWFPARYSFVIGFFICYIAGLEYEKLEDTPLLALVLPALTGIIVPLITCNVPTPIVAYGEKVTYSINVLGMFLYYGTLALVAAYLLNLKYKVVNTKIVDLAMSILIIGLIGVSSSDGATRVLKQLKKDNNGQKYETYLQDCEYQDGINKIKALETYENYRMELTVNRPGNYNEIDNNPMFYSYPGLNHFSSNSKRNVQNYFQALGYHNNGFFEKFDGGSTLSISSLLGLKYLIDDSAVFTRNKPIYQQNYPFVELADIKSTDKESLKFYKNDYAIPLGFVGNNMGSYYMSQGEYVDMPDGTNKIYWYDHFEYQNNIFKTFVSDVTDSSGNKKNIFQPLEIVSSQLLNLTYTEDVFGRKSFTTGDGAGYGQILITFKEPASGNYNLYFCEKNLYDDASYKIDNVPLEISNYWHKGIRGFERKPSGNHQLVITFKGEVKNREIIPEIYAEDIDVLGEYVTALKKQSSNNLKTKNSRFKFGFEGTFNVEKENQTFYFTLPYDKDFKVTIDGKTMKSEVKWDIFTGIPLTNVSLGTHTIKLTYKDSNFIFGFIITNIGIGGLVGVILLDKKYQKKQLN